MSLHIASLEVADMTDPKTQLEFTKSIFNKKRQVSRPLSRMRKLQFDHFAILSTKDKSIPTLTFKNGKIFVFAFNAEKLSIPLDRLSIHEFRGVDFITIHMHGRNVASIIQILRDRHNIDRSEFIEEVIAASKLQLGIGDPDPPSLRTPERAEEILVDLQEGVKKSHRKHRPKKRIVRKVRVERIVKKPRSPRKKKFLQPEELSIVHFGDSNVEIEKKPGFSSSSSSSDEDPDKRKWNELEEYEEEDANEEEEFEIKSPPPRTSPILEISGAVSPRLKFGSSDDEGDLARAQPKMVVGGELAISRKDRRGSFSTEEDTLGDVKVMLEKERSIGSDRYFDTDEGVIGSSGKGKARAHNASGVSHPDKTTQKKKVRTAAPARGRGKRKTQEKESSSSDEEKVIGRKNTHAEKNVPKGRVKKDGRANKGVKSTSSSSGSENEKLEQRLNALRARGEGSVSSHSSSLGRDKLEELIAGLEGGHDHSGSSGDEGKPERRGHPGKVSKASSSSDSEHDEKKKVVEGRTGKGSKVSSSSSSGNEEEKQVPAPKLDLAQIRGPKGSSPNGKDVNQHSHTKNVPDTEKPAIQAKVESRAAKSSSSSTSSDDEGHKKGDAPASGSKVMFSPPDVHIHSPESPVASGDREQLRRQVKRRGVLVVDDDGNRFWKLKVRMHRNGDPPRHHKKHFVESVDRPVFNLSGIHNEAASIACQDDDFIPMPTRAVPQKQDQDQASTFSLLMNGEEKKTAPSKSMKKAMDGRQERDNLEASSFGDSSMDIPNRRQVPKRERQVVIQTPKDKTQEEDSPKQFVLLTTMEVEREERPVLEIEALPNTEIPEKGRKQGKKSSTSSDDEKSSSDEEPGKKGKAGKKTKGKKSKHDHDSSSPEVERNIELELESSEAKKKKPAIPPLPLKKLSESGELSGQEVASFNDHPPIKPKKKAQGKQHQDLSTSSGCMNDILAEHELSPVEKHEGDDKKGSALELSMSSALDDSKPKSRPKPVLPDLKLHLLSGDSGQKSPNDSSKLSVSFQSPSSGKTKEKSVSFIESPSQGKRPKKSHKGSSDSDDSKPKKGKRTELAKIEHVSFSGAPDPSSNMEISDINRAPNQHVAAERDAISRELKSFNDDSSESFHSSEIDLGAGDMTLSSEGTSIFAEPTPSIDKFSPKKSVSSLSNIASEFRNFSSGDVDPFSTDHDERYPASDDANEALQQGDDEETSSASSFSSNVDDMYEYVIVEEEEEDFGEEPIPLQFQISPMASQSEFGLSKVLADISLQEDESALPTDLSISGLMSD